MSNNYEKELYEEWIEKTESSQAEFTIYDWANILHFEDKEYWEEFTFTNELRDKILQILKANYNENIKHRKGDRL